MTTPWVQPEDQQCVSAQGAPDPWRAFLAPIRDLQGPRPSWTMPLLDHGPF